MRPAGLVVALLALAIPGTAAAQSAFRLERSKTELGTRGAWVSAQGAKQFLGEAWVGLRASGSLGSPGLLQFGLGLKPSLARNRYSHALGEGGTDTRLLAGDSYLALLRDRPVSGSVRWLLLAHDQSTLGGAIGGVGGRRSDLQASLAYRNAALPLRLEYRNEAWTQQSFAGAEPVGITSSIETVQLSGQNRKTTFQVERRVNREPVEITYRLASLENRQSWGKGSQLALGLGALDQRSQVLGTLSSFQWSSGLHVQHLRTLWSDWSVSDQSWSLNGARSERRLASGVVTVQVRRGITGGLAASWLNAQSNAVWERDRRLEPRLSARWKLPLGASLGASAAVGYEHIEVERGEAAWVTISGESHRTDASGIFVLDHPDADSASLVLTAADGSLLVRGRDYEVSAMGGFLQILLLPGGRVSPGEVVLATYRYRAPDAVAAASWSGSYAGDLQVRGVRLYHRRWFRHPSAAGAADPAAAALQRLDWVTSGAQLALGGGPVRATLRAERDARRTGTRRLVASTLAANLSARASAGLQATLQGNYQWTRDGGSGYRVFAGRGSLDWWLRRALRAEAAVTAWQAVEQDTLRKRELGGSSRLAWEAGLLRLVVGFQFRDWNERHLRSGWLRAVPTTRWEFELIRRF